MHSNVYANGKIAVLVDMPLAASAGVLYGKGVFTTVRIEGGRPFLFEKHLRRLSENAKAIGLVPVDSSAIEEGLEAVIAANSFVSGRARITLLDASLSSIWGGSGEAVTELRIITGDLRPVPGELRLGVSPFAVNSASPLAGIKSCNYLENLLAAEEARGRGFHEAVRLNERGEIVSGVMSNIFWLSSGELFTPSLRTGCLPGTVREMVLENLECREAEAGIEALEAAEAIFLTSSGIGIRPVAEFAGCRMPGSSHPVLELWPF
ncbi:MAG: aminotransferase class IV [Acidobacteria bacterium]|nr:aminotransferase class IV [Acidobacteriota bacterium]